jgi:HEAT repeat protein
MKRFTDATDEDLRQQLLLIQEVALDAVPGSSAQVLVQSARLQAQPVPNLAPLFMAQRKDLAGLPWRAGIYCQLGKEPAEHLHALSRKVRACLEAAIPGSPTARTRAARAPAADPRPDPDQLRREFLANKEWLRPEAIPALQQMLMAENKSVRLILVELLSRIKDRTAGAALAQRAIFDLHPEVREAAVRALQERPREEYLPWFLEAFHYPWAPVACHAAEALVSLEVREAVPRLVKLLEEPDPCEPFTREVGKQKITVARELVRVNHLGNCILCHAPSFAQSDLVRGLVPIPGRELPAPVTTPQYYEGNQGVFVRADVTYLRQDFSLYQPVPRPGAWPSNQRYDYLVRVRPPSRQDLAARERLKNARGQQGCVQHQAVRYALRELTGRDPGPAAEDWKKLLYETPARSELVAEEKPYRLCEDLVKAPAARQRQLLETYQAQKGVIYTQALALAIPRLPEPLRREAREALCYRLTRMTARTLRDKLQDEDEEVRLAAVRACALKKAREHVPDLYVLLDDPEPVLVRTAQKSLKELTDQDFGPPAGATQAERETTVAEWKAWWQTRAGP